MGKKNHKGFYCGLPKSVAEPKLHTWVASLCQGLSPWIFTAAGVRGIPGRAGGGTTIPFSDEVFFGVCTSK